MRRICIFAGSNVGKRQEYEQAAQELGRALVARNLGIVYGGASAGLMGTIADTVLAAGGEAIGVIPQNLFKREVAHQQLTRLYTVNSMHERKAMMADLADGFIALPGGFGTFDELFEITTWAQIGIHTKPVGLFNVAGYFNPLLALVSHATTEGFVQPQHMHILMHEDTPEALLDAFANYIPQPYQSKSAEPLPER